MRLVKDEIQHQAYKRFYGHLEEFQLDMPWKIYDIWNLVSFDVGSVRSRISRRMKYGA